MKKSLDVSPPKEYHELLALWEFQQYDLKQDATIDNVQLPPVLLNFLHYYPCVTWVLNLPALQFEFMSNNAREVLGYDSKQFKEKGFILFNEILHPEDRINTWKLIKEIWLYILDVPSIERLKYKFNYDYRIIRPNGEVARILAQNKILQQDGYGNATHILGICNDITGWKTCNKQIASITSSSEHPASFLVFEKEIEQSPKVILSKREIQIVKLLAQGYSSKFIADKLCISFHTVNTHRQHMIQKTGTKNTGELILFAVYKGII